MTTTDMPRIPAAFTWQPGYPGTPHGRVRDLVLRVTGFDLAPSDELAANYFNRLWHTDPLAERFVDEVYYGEIGFERGKELLEQAALNGIDSIPDAPPSMRALFAELEAIPEWADIEEIERGAATWRRWAYDMGAMGNAGTIDTYTEAWLAVPLSLSGGYAGASALNRYLETSRWWIECAQPYAATTVGSTAKLLSIKVRVMHVSVRRGVAKHPEWNEESWGKPISQSAQMLTLLGGSVAPGLALFGIGHLSSPRELRASLEFNRYLGYLLGVDPKLCPTTFADGVRMLFHFDACRSLDSGAVGSELAASFVPSFAPQPDWSLQDKLRGHFHLHVQAGFSRLYILPWNRKRFDGLPGGWLGAGYLLARLPLLVAVEIARRLIPGVDRTWQKRRTKAWRTWLDWQTRDGEHSFTPKTQMRR
ncbi:hypothetical protein GOEFS_095_00290 [Gordonia effusa NBRC 100432]|uniref:ER-bound oxygenase mpaB/mpaB'/Rubber oxygenase catalytic domain-containing protein n=1 Tax=Gordonia effusa NBRC 100432 TaxID=1077974 RepID=H0R3Z3_9ACTN|nr:oxygenase MpaB family protein [Gordonia effusa]GAB19794.1 hypothetical protein GOEFS_095_00290 [Gordonia effusa NBRC 100432]